MNDRLLEGHELPVRAVAVLDSTHAVSASDDGTLRIWNVETVSCDRVLAIDGSGFREVQRLDREGIVTLDSVGFLQTWNVSSGSVLSRVSARSPSPDHRLTVMNPARVLVQS